MRRGRARAGGSNGILPAGRTAFGGERSHEPGATRSGSRYRGLLCKGSKALREGARGAHRERLEKWRAVVSVFRERPGKSIVRVSVFREALEDCGDALGKSIVPNDRRADVVSVVRRTNDRLAEHVSVDRQTNDRLADDVSEHRPTNDRLAGRLSVLRETPEALREPPQPRRAGLQLSMKSRRV